MFIVLASHSYSIPSPLGDYLATFYLIANLDNPKKMIHIKEDKLTKDFTFLSVWER